MMHYAVTRCQGTRLWAWGLNGRRRIPLVKSLMRKKFLVLLVVGVVAAGLSLTCSPVYVLRAGYEQGKLLSRRTPIMDVLNDPRTDARTRDKLALVLQARTFAERTLELNTGESYTTYSWTDGDTLALVLSAARKDRFEPYTWWFPIVGHVPYKGFFSTRAVAREAQRLEERGYDTYVRPVAAFSTLGWFNDPLMDTLLRYDDVALASTVIHELAHNTLFLPGQGAFNESFATFVGDRGAIELFCRMEGETGARCDRARAAWSDNLIFGEFLTDVVAELEALYARADLTPQERLALREEIFRSVARRFAEDVRPRMQTDYFRGFERTPLNNATLISRRLYYHRLHLFDEVFERYAHDLPAAIHAIVAAAEADRGDPYGAVERLARGSYDVSRGGAPAGVPETEHDRGP
jgi:predicted aminopeptidase